MILSWNVVQSQEYILALLNLTNEMDALSMTRCLLALEEIGHTILPQEWILDGIHQYKWKELKIINQVLSATSSVLIGVENTCSGNE